MGQIGPDKQSTPTIKELLMSAQSTMANSRIGVEDDSRLRAQWLLSIMTEGRTRTHIYQQTIISRATWLKNVKKKHLKIQIQTRHAKKNT